MTDRTERSQHDLRALLHGASASVASLTALLGPVEAVIAKGLADGSVAAEDRAALQDVDRLAQSLDAIATFLQQLSCAAPPDLRVDARCAIDAVPLEDLRVRLAATGPSRGRADAKAVPTGAAVGPDRRIDMF